MWNRTVVKRT
uniref:Uncharacterized protein n=1 Tax=Anguilla anguilla TaxID=7936 RepID=A0A0E9RAY3_ANGAN